MKEERKAEENRYCRKMIDISQRRARGREIARIKLCSGVEVANVSKTNASNIEGRRELCVWPNT